MNQILDGIIVLKSVNAPTTLLLVGMGLYVLTSAAELSKHSEMENTVEMTEKRKLWSRVVSFFLIALAFALHLVTVPVPSDEATPAGDAQQATQEVK